MYKRRFHKTYYRDIKLYGKKIPVNSCDAMLTYWMLRKLFKVALFFIFIVSLHSCSCNFHLKKARGKCGYASDTITIHDTIIIAKTKYDTAFSLREIWHDTLIIVKGKDTYQFFYDTNKRQLNFNHDRDTIRVPYEKKVIVNKYKMSLPWWVNWLKWLVLCIILMVTGIYVWSKVKPRIINKLNK